MKKRTVIGFVMAAMACAMSMTLMFGCTSGGGAATNNAAAANNAAANTNTPAAQNAAPAPPAKAKSIDLTAAGASSADVKAAFNTEDKDYVCDVKANGKFEVKTSSSGKNSYVLHLYVGGNDFKESIYCDCSAVSNLPESGAMVNVEGTWKHMEGSSNDSAFLCYISSIQQA